MPRSAKWAVGNDPRVRYGLNRCRDVLLTALADYDKGMDAVGRRAMEHHTSIGEYKAKMSTSSRFRAGHQRTLNQAGGHRVVPHATCL